MPHTLISRELEGPPAPSLGGPRVRRALAANILGRGAAAAIGLACIPFYVKVLGIEGYGLIGFFLSLAGMLSLFDLGLSPALTRELARQPSADLVRTVETVYWSTGFALALIMLVAAPWLSLHWVKLNSLSAEAVRTAIICMGVALACQWPATLYGSALAGLNKQVGANTLSFSAAAIRNLGAVCLLWYIGPSVKAFFLWQAAAGLGESCAGSILLWRSMPAGARAPQFDGQALRGIWRFAAGTTGISGLGIILTQLDKLILSHMLGLGAFGYYMLATRISNGLYYLVTPVASALFPRLSSLAGSPGSELSALYHRGCQMMSVIILPLAITVALFSKQVLMVWTGDPVLANGSHVVLSLLIIGTALNALMSVPLTLQLAHGWIRLTLTVNAIAVVTLGPAIYFMAREFRGVGAAAMWIVLNCGYVIFLMRAMHRRLLPGELRRWYVEDIGKPFVAGLLPIVACTVLIEPPASRWGAAAYLMTVAAMGTFAAAMGAAEVRRNLVAYLQTALKRYRSYKRV